MRGRPRKPLGEKLVPAKVCLTPRMFDRIDRISRRADKPVAWVIRDLLTSTLREPKKIS